MGSLGELSKSRKTPNAGFDFYECLPTAKAAGELDLQFPTSKLGYHNGWQYGHAVKLIKLIL